MNPFFSQRRDRLLTYQAMREGRITATRRKACPECGEESTAAEWSRNRQVCPRCGYHSPIGAYYRLFNILDPGSFQELDEKLMPADPLEFPGYPDKLEKLEEETGLMDAAVSAVGKIQDRRAVFAVLGQLRCEVANCSKDQAVRARIMEKLFDYCLRREGEVTLQELRELLHGMGGTR